MKHRAGGEWLVTLLAFGAGCAGAGQAPTTAVFTAVEPDAGPATSRAATVAPAASSSSVGTAASSGAASASPAPAPSASSAASSAGAPTNVRSLCLKWCGRLTGRCSETAVKSCQKSCTRYEVAAGCDVEAREAFGCAERATDIQCAAITPLSCNHGFLKLDACAKGETVALPEEKQEIPSGWERFRPASGGFSVVLPKGATERREGPEPTWEVASAPYEYSVKILPAPPEEPTQKNFIKIAMRVLGPSCSQKLTLRGMLEYDGHVSIRYDSECKGGPARHGLFHVVKGKMYMLTVSGPKQPPAERDTFLYGLVTD